jgi:malonate-semialdehyde dehydrogenase (acetylating)/methylmalonate-semialdehyde dehydrogenase
MALPVIVVENVIADQLVAEVARLASALKLGHAYGKVTDLGLVINRGHKEFVLNWIETRIKEGAKLVLDGRRPKVLPG